MSIKKHALPSQYIRRTKNLLCTSLLKDCKLSINAGDNTKIDISEGYGIVVDNYTDPLNPVYNFVHYPGITGYTPTYLNTAQGSFLSIGATGNIVEYLAQPNEEQRRDAFQLGGLIHIDLTTIQKASSFSGNIGFDLGTTFRDFTTITGIINCCGNLFLPSSGVQAQRTSGQMFAPMLNIASSKKNPNFITTSPEDPASLFRVWRDATGDWTIGDTPVTDVPTDVYDDGLGTASGPDGTFLPNKFTICRMYYSPDLEQNFFYYGQNIYNTIAEAKNNFQIETFETNPLLAFATFRAWVIIKKGATDLTDDTQAIFIPVGAFGGIGGSAATSVTPGDTITHIAFADSPYTVLASDDIILADPTLGAIIVILPDSASDNDGKDVQVIMENNTHDISITTVGGTQTIGGLTTQVITDTSEAITVLSDYNNGSNSSYEIKQDSRAHTDANFHLKNATDLTKVMDFDASGISTGTTRTLTIPNANGTIALVGDNVSEFNNDAGYLTTISGASHTLLSDIGITTHAQIDTAIAYNELQKQLKSAYSTAYKKATYDSDKLLTKVEVWITDSMITKLFTKDITYNSNKLKSTETITDEIAVETLTKTQTYNSDNLKDEVYYTYT